MEGASTDADLQNVLQCIWEVQRCREDQKRDRTLGGPFLGECDWLSELRRELALMKTEMFYRPSEPVNPRKQYPLFSGLLKYFPDALMEVAHTSYVGNEQHNPGQPLHWDRAKSQDEPDALMRHLKDAGTLDTDGVKHSAKVCWRALAMLQKEIEADRSQDDDISF